MPATPAVTGARSPSERGVTRRALITGVEAAAGSAIAAVVVATIAKGLGVQHAKQLQPGALVALTVIGVAIGTAVWVLVSRRATDPDSTLRRLVPMTLAVSLVPDVVIGLGGDSWGAAVTLGLAHVSVFCVSVSLLSWHLRPASLRR